jgi:hypothetical protein
MGNLELGALVALALGAWSCVPKSPQETTEGSLFLMNQTHEEHTLAQFRAPGLDCAEVAAAPQAALERAQLELEPCLSLRSGELVALDRDPLPRIRPRCEAVALEGPGLEPQAIFWTSVERSSAADGKDDERLIALVAVGPALVLEPVKRAVFVPLTGLPPSYCLGAR